MSGFDSERLELPSASSGALRARCRGAWNLICELRAAGKIAPETDSPAAQSGTRIHESRAAGEERHEQIMLDYSEKKTAQLLTQIEEDLVAGVFSGEEPVLIGREERLWMRNGITPLSSGRYDYAYRDEDWTLVLIVDDKTGRVEVSEAADNDQLRELAALAYLNFPRTVERFDVAIVQPWITHEPSIATFDRFEAELAVRLLRLNLLQISDPEAVRTPGKHCGYCPAIAHCEENRLYTGRTTKLSERIKAGELDLPLGERGKKFLDSVLVAERICSEIKALYKTALENDSDAVPGYYLKEGRRIRELVEPKMAFERLGLSLDQFLACGSFSLPALEEALALACGLSPKEGEKELAKLAGDLIQTRRAAPTLTPIGRRGRAKEALP